MKKAENQKKRFWQPMIDHINGTWKAATKKEFNYPFTSKDFADLKYHARNFGEWGVMALWDVYVNNADEYVQKKQFDIFTFTRSLPRLLDDGLFKMISRQYEAKLCGPLPAPLQIALKTAVANKLPPKPNKQAAIRRHFAAVDRFKRKEGMLPGMS